MHGGRWREPGDPVRDPNTAKATWDKGAASTSEGSATGWADVVSEFLSSVGAIIDVTDPMAPANTFTTFTDSGRRQRDVVLGGTPGRCEQVGKWRRRSPRPTSRAAPAINLCIVKPLTASKSG